VAAAIDPKAAAPVPKPEAHPPPKAEPEGTKKGRKRKWSAASRWEFSVFYLDDSKAISSK